MTPMRMRSLAPCAETLARRVPMARLVAETKKVRRSQIMEVLGRHHTSAAWQKRRPRSGGGAEGPCTPATLPSAALPTHLRLQLVEPVGDDRERWPRTASGSA